MGNISCTGSVSVPQPTTDCLMRQRAHAIIIPTYAWRDSRWQMKFTIFTILWWAAGVFIALLTFVIFWLFVCLSARYISFTSTVCWSSKNQDSHQLTCRFITVLLPFLQFHKIVFGILRKGQFPRRFACTFCAHGKSDKNMVPPNNQKCILPFWSYQSWHFLLVFVTVGLVTNWDQARPDYESSHFEGDSCALFVVACSLRFDECFASNP